MPYQPVVKVWLHSGPPARLPRWGPRSTGDASPPHPNAAAALGTPAGAALLLLQILAVFSVVAPCPRGASPVSVRRQTFTTGCYGLPCPDSSVSVKLTGGDCRCRLKRSVTSML